MSTKDRVPFFPGWSPFKRLGGSVVLAVVLSFLCFAILELEYGVLNFGDSDLPPYQPDTLFEKVVDALWYAVTFSAGLIWLFVIVYAITLLFKHFKRRPA
jgi:hypothetical protein